jgi:hypothetical protein
MGRQEKPFADVNAVQKYEENTRRDSAGILNPFFEGVQLDPCRGQAPPGATQLRYVDSFDSYFTLLLRERISTSLDAIMSNVVKVEVNMMASGKIKMRFNQRNKRPQGDAQPSTSWSSYDKFDMMMKMMEIMSMGNRPVTREQNDPQPRNHNFRRGQVPQIRHRDPGD